MKRKTMKMVTTYMSHRQVDEFKKEAKEKGVTFAEMLRRALDAHIDNKYANTTK